MLTTPPSAIPNPQLAQEPVAKLLLHFTTALASWLTDSFGLVQTGVLKDGKSRYPQLYMQDGDKFSKGLWPDEKMGALSFFEFDGPTQLTLNDPTARAGEFVHQLAVVVWVNLERIDKRGYDYSPELAIDMLTRGLLLSPDGKAGRITPAEIEQRAERIFLRYDFPQEKHQLLMYPFAGFRIPFTVRQPYLGCAPAFQPAPMMPPAPEVVLPQFVLTTVNVAAGRAVGYPSEAGAVLYDARWPAHSQALYGIAVTSAPAGQQVKVQSGGVITIPGWGLTVDGVYIAGPEGQLVLNTAENQQNLAFSQIIGRAITADSLLYLPEMPIILNH